MLLSRLRYACPSSTLPTTNPALVFLELDSYLINRLLATWAKTQYSSEMVMDILVLTLCCMLSTYLFLLYVACCMLNTYLFLHPISSVVLSGAMGRVIIRTYGFRTCACRFSGNGEAVRCYKSLSFWRQMCVSLLLSPCCAYFCCSCSLWICAQYLELQSHFCQRSARTHLP
jgi:hypothetical protein